MSGKDAFAAVAIALVAATALVAIVFLIAQGIQHGDRLNAEVKTACIEAGGTWINNYNLCINDGKAN